MIFGLPLCSAGKESARTVGDLGSIPGLGRSPGEWKGYPLQYPGLENSMDCIVHGGHKELDTTEQLSLSYLSDLLHLICQPLGPSILLQMALFHIFMAE